MKNILYTVLVLAIIVGQVSVCGADNLLFADKHGLPPEIISFINAQEQRALALAQKDNFELSSACKDFFAAATAGRLQEADNIHVFQDASAPGYLTPLTEIMRDSHLAIQAFENSDADLVMALGHGLMNSVTRDSILFGGTDPGRGLPTALCQAPGDPIFVVSQNVFADGRYMQYLRDMYGSRIQIPSTNEVQQIQDDYLADALRRQKLNQLKPGETLRMVDGKPGADGVVAVMEMNAQIAKSIFDKNPEREFFVEESYPLDWMYPYLSPQGLILKLNRKPLVAMQSEVIKNNADFWSQQMTDKLGGWPDSFANVSNVCSFGEKLFAEKSLADFKGNAHFIADNYTLRAYAHMRKASAGLYAWRLNPQCPEQYHPKDDDRKKIIADAADLGFRQAFALCPYLPETVYNYVNFLLAMHRLDDALLIVKTAHNCDPHDPMLNIGPQMENLISNLEKFRPAQKISSGTPSAPMPNKSERLKKVKALYDQGLINKDDYDKKVKEIMNSL